MFKYSLEKDGLTQGLLMGWQACRQKAQWSMQGYSSKYSSFALTYGTIGHAVLERMYKSVQGTKQIPSPSEVKATVGRVEKEWLKENSKADKKALEQLELSCLIAELTLPLYFEYWSKDEKKMQWVQLEHEFAIPYKTANGHATVLRGKMDGVFKNPNKLWLFETKFKSRIDEDDLMDTISFDFQALFYLFALYLTFKQIPAGFLYNIVRRIELRQGKNETITQFAQRAAEDIRSRPEHYFIRREVSIGKEELLAFGDELERLIVDFIEWYLFKEKHHYKNTGSCITKYGRCDYLHLCAGHGTTHYIKREQMYRELEMVE